MNPGATDDGGSSGSISTNSQKNDEALTARSFYKYNTVLNEYYQSTNPVLQYHFTYSMLVLTTTRPN